YAIFPANGQSVKARGITSVFDAQGSDVSDHPVEREQVIPDTVAFQMTSMLRDVIERGTGASARTLGVRGPVAGKTGTTDDYNDAWFVGFSTEVVAAVWGGVEQPAPLRGGAWGARVARPIGAEFRKRSARLLPPAEFGMPA